MNMFKKVIAVFTALMLIFTGTVAAYADNDASTLTDITNHWAKQYITNVYNKGLMDAASGTMFKPDEKIQRYDVIVAITRMMRAEEAADLSALVEKYKTSVLDKYSVPENAKAAIAFCLEKEILTAYDVQWFADYPNVNKIDASVYLGKAFGVKYDPLTTPPAVLSFTDTSDIPGMYQKHVEFLINIGVIDAKGDASGKFNPYTQITRAIFAKMLDLSNTAYEKDYLKLDNTTDTGNTGNTGSTGNTGGTDTGSTGNTGTVITPGEGETIAEGYVDSVIPEYSKLVVSIKQNDNTTKNTTFNIVEGEVPCTIDEVPSRYWKLKKGDVVTLILKDGKLVKIIAESKIQKVKAVLKDIRIEDKIILEVQTEKGETKSYALTASTKVIKDGKEAAYTDLKAGMSLTIISQYQELIEVNADVTKSSYRGLIESISFSRTAPAKIVITREDGETVEYYVSSTIENKNIIVAGKEADIYSLRPNMTVDLSLENEEIVKIVTVEQDTSVNISGVVKSVNYDVSIIVLEYTDSTNTVITKYIYASKAKIADKALNTLTINDIKAGMKLLNVIGVEDLGGIIAETIMVDK
ncbi:MAG: S-layer homology domain-containing protein [Bacillota bacterium]